MRAVRPREAVSCTQHALLPHTWPHPCFFPDACQWAHRYIQVAEYFTLKENTLCVDPFDVDFTFNPLSGDV